MALPQIGRYQIEGVLGKGAMGIVYKGIDPVINRVVAIKTIHQHHLDEENAAEMRLRFQREAQTAGQCIHPRIISVFDYGEHDGMPFIAMEYVEGTELKEVMKIPGLLDNSQKLKIVHQVLEGLEFAHNLGIVHRDIKPANIILLKSGEIKIADFGIASIDDSNITQAGFILGTPGYMSPEQIRGEKTDPRADLFSVGVMLYEMLAGRPPFVGENSTATLTAILSVAPRLVTEHNGSLPRCMNALVFKALEKDRDTRYRSARHFAMAIDRVCTISKDMSEKEGSEIFTRPTEVVLPQLEPPQTILAQVSMDSNGTISSASSHPSWNSSAIRKLEISLAEYIGPLARNLVQRDSSGATNLNELVKKLAEHIPDNEERESFISGLSFTAEESSPVMEQTGVTFASTEVGGSNDSFSSGEIEGIKEALIFYVGPIGGLLVKNAIAETGSRGALHSMLAEHIPTEEERLEFLQKIS